MKIREDIITTVLNLIEKNISHFMGPALWVLIGFTSQTIQAKAVPIMAGNHGQFDEQRRKQLETIVGELVATMGTLSALAAREGICAESLKEKMLVLDGKIGMLQMHLEVIRKQNENKRVQDQKNREQDQKNREQDQKFEELRRQLEDVKRAQGALHQ